MDLTIAAMSDAERATLSNILDRGLSSLTKRQREDGTAAAAVQTLKQVFRETPNLTTYTAHILKRLAFEPRGLRMLGVNQSVLHSLALTDEVEEVGGTWLITDLGWARLWNSGAAAAILADRHGITLPEVAA